MSLIEQLWPVFVGIAAGLIWLIRLEANLKTHIKNLEFYRSKHSQISEQLRSLHDFSIRTEEKIKVCSQDQDRLERAFNKLNVRLNGIIK